MYYLTVPKVRSPTEVSLGCNEVLTGLRFFSEDLRENLFLCLFQFLQATHIPWLMAPFFQLQSLQGLSKSFSHPHLCLHWESFSVFMNAVITLSLLDNPG